MPTDEEVGLEGAQPRPLVRIRLEQGLSRRALTCRAGCSPATIYGTEKGCRVPIPQTARKLSEALGVQLLEVQEFRVAIEEWTDSQEPDEYQGRK